MTSEFTSQKRLTWQGQGSSIYPMESMPEEANRIMKVCSSSDSSRGTLTNQSDRRGTVVIADIVQEIFPRPGRESRFALNMWIKDGILRDVERHGRGVHQLHSIAVARQAAYMAALMSIGITREKAAVVSWQIVSGVEATQTVNDFARVLLNPELIEGIVRRHWENQTTEKLETNRARPLLEAAPIKKPMRQGGLA